MENDFDSKVNQQVARLKKDKYQVIESEVSKKRISWFKQNHKDINDNKPVSPRKAYELLFLVL